MTNLQKQITTIRKCADSIVSDDGVVQSALYECADNIESAVKINEVELNKNWSIKDKLIFKHSRSIASFIRLNGYIKIDGIETVGFIIRDGFYKLLKQIDVSSQQEIWKKTQDVLPEYGRTLLIKTIKDGKPTIEKAFFRHDRFALKGKRDFFVYCKDHSLVFEEVICYCYEEELIKKLKSI